MKTKLFTIAMMVAFIMTAMMKVQAQNFEGPCLPSAHGLNGHQSAFCGSTEVQTIALSAGWNWVSINVEGDPVQLLQAFKAGLGENGIVIKSFSSGSTDYYAGYGWYGTLDNVGIMNEQMYMVKVGANCTVELQGMPANPASHEITINPSWNWIGFPCAELVAIQTALTGFDAQPGDVIKYKIGSSDYYAGYGWWGTIETLVPGQGYMYYSSSTQPKTLIFSTTAEGKRVFLQKRKE